jgi:bifunctional non-homologous end joining protein LigD
MPWSSTGRRGRSTRAPAAFITPCLPTVTERPPTGAGWVHEIKHDGYRLQIHFREGRVRLFTRTGVDWSNRFPWIAEDVALLGVQSAVFDAEGCCAGKDGVTDFDALHSRLNDHLVFAYAFDLLFLDEADLRREPLKDRRTQLAKVLRKAKPGIRLSEHIEADGATVFAHACKLGFEGIVSKRLDGTYQSGRARTWLKVKNKKAPGYLRIQEGTF